MNGQLVVVGAGALQFSKLHKWKGEDLQAATQVALKANVTEIEISLSMSIMNHSFFCSYDQVRRSEFLGTAD